jgi:hypothetical protein
MTKLFLLQMMFAKNSAKATFNYNGKTYIFSSCQREDGSGTRFNITATNTKTNQKETFFVNLLDN